MAANPPFTYDFFVSYTGKDKAWAEWIAWQLEAAGYTVIIQAWDFKSGGVFPADMHDALKTCARVLGILSPDYLLSAFCQAEWLSAFKDDPVGEAGRLVLVRIVDCKPTGLLAGRTYIDLVGEAGDAAAALLLQRLKPGRAKPSAAPLHPGAVPKAPDSVPIFPGPPRSELPRLMPFFGREKELSMIADALDMKKRTWGALIDGPGGMGKTSLAIRAAELVPNGQFDCILFVTSKARKLTPDGEFKLPNPVVPSYLDMLNEMARLLRIPHLAVKPKDERPAQIKEALESCRALLILDNLENIPKEQQNQIFDFLSDLPRFCKAIVTSRRRTDVDARIIRLGKMDMEPALAFLEELSIGREQLAKAKEPERLQLYEETGGNPLLMRWLAAQLGKGRCRTVPKALDFLRSAPPDNDPLEFIFGDLVETFSESETKVLAALTYFTTPMEVRFIAELGGTSKTAAQTALEDLTSRALVMPDETEEKFILAAMVADFLRRKRPEAVRETGGRLANRAYALIVENGYQNHDRFSLLETAWPTVAPALQLFLAGENKRLQTVCDALRRFLDFTGRWDEWLSLEKQAEAKALTVGDRYNAGWRAQRTGWIHYISQQEDEALICVKRAIAHWNESKAGAFEFASAIRLRGLVLGLQGNYSACITALRESLKLFRSINTASVDVANVLNDTATAEQLSGNSVAAEQHFGEALAIARKFKDAEGVATAAGNLAQLALDRHEWSKAETLAREALSLAKTLGRQELSGLGNHRLALALIRQNKKKETRPYAEEAVRSFTTLKSPRLEKAVETLKECES